MAEVLICAGWKTKHTPRHQFCFDWNAVGGVVA